MDPGENEVDTPALELLKINILGFNYEQQIPLFKRKSFFIKSISCIQWLPNPTGVLS